MAVFINMKKPVLVIAALTAAGGDAECPDSGDDLVSIVYPEPPTTYCLSLVQKSSA